MSRFSVDHKNGIYYLKGQLNEHADLDLLSTAPEKQLILNCRSVEGMNSIGVIHFMEFIETWQSRPVEYHECSMEFLSSLILIPSLNGPAENTATIVSFDCLYGCIGCGHSTHELVQTKQLRLERDHFVLPEHRCTGCGKALAVHQLGEEIFNLYELGAIKFV